MSNPTAEEKPEEPKPKTYLIQLAESYYAVASDLARNGHRALEMAEILNQTADRMCEQNMRDLAKAEGNGNG